MASNLNRRLRGPGFIRYRGVTIFTKDAIAFDPQINPFAVESDTYGDIDSRYAGRVIRLTFTPVGVWTASALAVLFPFQDYLPGQFNTPTYNVSDIATDTYVLTVLEHGQVTGTGVRFASTGDMPTGLDEATTYYLHVVDADTVKVCATEADAIAGANYVHVTSAGTGDLTMIQNSPLIIQFLDAQGTQLTLWNAAITKMPSLDLSSQKTPFGSVEIEGYALHGTSWTDDDSVFTLGTGNLTGSIDPTQIPTVPFTAKFGNIDPFMNLQPRDGVSVDFSMETDDVASDSDGVLCKSISRISAQAKLRPLNILQSDLLGEIKIQGSGAARGASVPSDELDIFGPGNNPYIALYGAMLQNAPLKIGTKEDRIDELMFKTKRTFSGGAIQPVFFVGVAAPPGPG